MTNRCLTLFVMLMLAVGSPACAQAQAQAQAQDRDWVDCAQDLDDERSIRGCTAVLNRGRLESTENRAIALNNRGNAYRRRGNRDAAMTDYNEGVWLNPRDAHLRHSRGILRHSLGNLDDALADYNEAIRLNPRNAAAFLNRGALYRDRNNLDAALVDVDEAIRLNPRYALAFHVRGVLHSRRGNLVAAQQDFRAAVAEGNTAAQPDLDAVQRQLAQAAPAPQSNSFARATPPPSSTALTERRVALVIGNSAYRAPGVPPLPNPPRDVRTMAALFREIGFQHVASYEDLTQSGMRRALQEFEREAERADWAVVYFAGHGIEINGTNHLIPVDAQLGADTDVPDEAVALDRVLDRLGRARKLRLVILDACRDNPFLPRMRRNVTRSVTRGLAPIEDSQLQAGTMVAFAARAGQVAEDGSGNSPFVQSLSRRMREPNVEINLLFRRVRDDVLASTGRRQEPFIYASLPGEELFIRRQP